IRPLLRDAERNMPAARMPHQVDRPWADLLDEGDDVADMLGHAIVAADAVPMFGKEMAQADRDDSVLARQWPEHGIPGAEIAKRAVYADQRMTLPDLEIGHVVIVDAQGLHGQLPKNSSTISEKACGACSNIGCVVFGIIAVLALGTCAASVCSTFGSRPFVFS